MTIPEQAVQAALRAWLHEEEYAYILEEWLKDEDRQNDMRAALTAAAPHLAAVRVKDDARKALDRFSFAAQQWGWQSDQGYNDTIIKETKDEFDASYSELELILSGLEPSAGRAAVLEEGDLNARLKAKGMYSIEELMGELPLDRWRVHSGMTDLKFFGEWLERKAREYLTMKAAYDVGDKDESDELYEWVLAHYGAFHDVLVNFRAAIAHPVADKPDEAGAQGEVKLERSIERWRNMNPAEVMRGSQAQIMYALEDARKDILALAATLPTPPSSEVA